jgi:hypothetical protein
MWQLPLDAIALTESALPIDLLHVTVHLNRQAVTAFRPPSFQDFTPISGGHAGAKTMHAQSTTNLGLISSLRHTSFFSYLSKIIFSSAAIMANGSLHTKDDYTLSSFF